MRRLVVLMAAMTMISLLPGFASADVTMVRGGGTGTFGRDLDGDGNVDGSQFGMGVRILGDGEAQGHFLCLMAGRSEILDLSVMSVAGRVTEGDVNGDGSATFSGVGSVNLGNGVVFRDVEFSVTVWPGGPGDGKLQLTVIDEFAGTPGDTNLSNDDYDLPNETVVSGQITIG